MERLSSRGDTLFVRFVFTPLFCGVSAFGAFTAWFHPDMWVDHGSLMDRLVSLSLVGGSLLLLRHAVRLRDVRLNDGGLTVSGWRKVIHVPFGAITGVEHSRSRGGAVSVSLTLAADTPLGRDIAFMAERGESEAILDELRRRAGLGGG